MPIDTTTPRPICQCKYAIFDTHFVGLEYTIWAFLELFIVLSYIFGFQGATVAFLISSGFTLMWFILGRIKGTKIGYSFIPQDISGCPVPNTTVVSTPASLLTTTYTNCTGTTMPAPSQQPPEPLVFHQNMALGFI